MKIKTTLLAGFMVLGILAAVAILADPFTARAQSKSTGISTTQRRPTSVALQCRNYGGQQDVSKNPDIINSTKQTIPSGRTLYWKATDGDKGSVVLNQSLAPGGKVGVNGKPGQSYTCTAWMAAQ